MLIKALWKMLFQYCYLFVACYYPELSNIAFVMLRPSACYTSNYNTANTTISNGSFENQVGKQNLLTLEKSNFPVIK